MLQFAVVKTTLKITVKKKITVNFISCDNDIMVMFKRKKKSYWLKDTY